jgi:ABC-type branched-subunit amino acid transport system substrate-binding protein
LFFHNRLHHWAAGALLAAVCLAAPPAKAAQGEIVLGMSAAFTGASARLGLELYRGSMSELAAVNAAGGVHGRQIRVIAYDDAYDPTRAILNPVKLIDQDGVFLLFNYVGTPTVTRVLPVLTKFSDRHALLFFPFTGAQPQREAPYDRVAFNLRASYRDETRALVDHFWAQGRRRIAVFYQIDAYGRSGWDGVAEALDTHGANMTGEATYRRGTPYTANLGAQVSILRDAGADAVICIGAYAASAAFIRDAVNAGWDVPIANVSFVGSESMLDLLVRESKTTGRDYTSRLVNSQVVPSYEDLSLEAVREYRDRIARYAPGPPPGFEAMPNQSAYSFVGFEGFLNAKLLVRILEKMTGTPDPAALRPAVESLRAIDLGISAPVTFAPGRNQGLDAVYLTRVEGGRFVPLTADRR